MGDVTSMPRLPRIVLSLLLLLPGWFHAAPLLAHEITPEYLESWYQGERRYWEGRLAELRESEVALVKAVEDAREEVERAEKVTTRTARRVARGSEQKALSTLERTQARIRQAETALEVIAQLRDSGTSIHLTQPSRIEGDTSAFAGDAHVPLEATTRLTAGEQIATGEDGLIELLSTDGSTVQLGPNSLLRIAAIEGDYSTYHLERGKLHASFRCIEVAQQDCRTFTLATPSFTGTGEEMEVTLEVDHSGEQTLVVFSGGVNVQAPASADAVPLSGGLMIQWGVDQALHGPFNMNLNWVKRWWE